MRTWLFAVLYVVLSLVLGLFAVGPFYAVLRDVEVPGTWALMHSGILFLWPLVAILCSRSLQASANCCDDGARRF